MPFKGTCMVIYQTVCVSGFELRRERDKDWDLLSITEVIYHTGNMYQ